ncbi:excisionase family DNA-binding protein [Bacillus sp. B-jedd]|uniref:excisionase family DNA-binding protein n=1 Tax=Bacillus sp. B-jedd TaxID=1476857 RepID=UPI0005155D14|nr:excisionase family DNA-binding protein [Bacillus sp. B-jedd]CEG28352.1 excisionase family DNA binding domain-containing protein [Bacillus sp. B-jedd]
MYLTIKETAEYLSLPESHIKVLIGQKRIRAVFDGEQYLINREQFNNHFDHVEQVKRMIEEWRNEPIPEDPDIKDED